MFNQRQLLYLPIPPISRSIQHEVTKPTLLQTALRLEAQTEESSFTRVRFEQLKKISGRLTRLLQRHHLAPAVFDERRLLVVDDEESILFSMSDYFSQHGFIVDTACHPTEAERLIESADYDVVIQDLRLSIGSSAEGMDIIKLVHQRSPRTRIVVLTSYGSSQNEAEARRNGADAFLHKPKPLSQVAQVIQGLMEAPAKRATPSS